jgi:hypothetical protein
MRSKLISARVAFVFFAALCISATPARAQDDDKAADRYDAVWKPLAELIRKREYGTAIALLDDQAEDAEFSSFSQRIQADKAAVVGLQMLERIVREQAAKLAKDDPLEVGGIKYEVVKFETGPKGDGLRLKLLATGKEQHWALPDIPAAAWLAIAGERLKSLDYPSLTQGVFLGFDRSADPKAARKMLNAAAGDGVANVSVWLARLEGRATSSKPATVDTSGKGKAGEDPIVGSWSVHTGKGKWLHMIIEYRADGRSVVRFPPAVLVEMRKRKVPQPKSNPLRGTWTKDGEGNYRSALLNGAAEFTLVGERLVGKNAKGEPFIGLRQAKKAK